jgi:dolichol-phosphate mannosyltransferase
MAEFAVVIPTFNEIQNVKPLIGAVSSVLEGMDFEMVFVDDDSPDGTARLIREISRADPRIRLVHRIHRRGLSSAVVEGMMASNAPYIAVMDGDLQHDETVLPTMFQHLQTSAVDIVVGTRHQKSGSMGELPADRVALSHLGRRLSSVVCHAAVSDPMSGFFALRRDYLDEVVDRLSCVGYKILLDLLASARRHVRIEEVGYVFRTRMHGESKLDLVVLFEYLELLLDKLVGRWVPVAYALFCLVGALGVLAQLILMQALLSLGGLRFETAQLDSSLLVIAVNYTINNQITFRRRRLRGLKWIRGLALFAISCSLGLYLNLRAAGGLYRIGIDWKLASLAGILIASVWNYAVSTILVWRVNYRRA